MFGRSVLASAVASVAVILLAGVSSQGEGAAIPVGLDPRMASSAHTDL